MDNEFTPLEKAAHDYVIEQSVDIHGLSSTIKNLIHNAFVNGACWAVNNPVLTRDLERRPLMPARMAGKAGAGEGVRDEQGSR